MPQGRLGAGTPGARTGGWTVVWWLTVTAVAFVVATAVVMALARSSTARWEREKRAARAPRREAVAPPTPSAGTGARVRGVLSGTAAAVRRIAESGRGAVRAVIGVLVTARKGRLSSVRPSSQGFGTLRKVVHRARNRSSRWLGTRAPIWLVGRGQADMVDPEPELPRTAQPVRRRGVRLPRRGALHLLHRHGRDQTPGVLQTGSERDRSAS
jgi:hypothetical protein